MTEELRHRANVLHKQIENLTNEIALVEDMHHCDYNLHITCDTIGEITIAGDDELKDDIIDMLLNRLNTKKGEAEDDYRLL